MSPVLAAVSLVFGPTEYASMIVMALVTAFVLSSNSLATTMAMTVTGLVLANPERRTASGQ